MYRNLVYIVLLCPLWISCVQDDDHDPVAQNCEVGKTPNTTIAQIKELYQGELLQIQQELVLEATVVSSDKAGNFFKELHIQDFGADDPQGIRLELDLRDLHLFYPAGSKVRVVLKGLFLGKNRRGFALGGTFSAFGSTQVGRLPALLVPDHITRTCDPIGNRQDPTLELGQIDSTFVSTLVRVEGIEVNEMFRDSTFSQAREETDRILNDCQGNSLLLRNSGFADFQAEPLPLGNGSVTGIVIQEGDDLGLVIRELTDVSLNGPTCLELMPEISSDSIFISELADPNNNARARFVELFNASDQDIPMRGWQLLRYTNGNVDVGSTIDLSGLEISASGTLVLAANAEVFNEVYGFEADLEAGSNSAADSNGDDNIVLIDPFGEVIDIFGVIGEDGSGTDHEFEDGRAFRIRTVEKGRTDYDPDEWIIHNDSGLSGTINLPQNAPEDFTPGERN